MIALENERLNKNKKNFKISKEYKRKLREKMKQEQKFLEEKML